MENKENPIALDYIISRDVNSLKNKKKRKRIYGKNFNQVYRDKLTVRLKNAIMFHIVKSRILKRLPTFNEII